MLAQLGSCRGAAASSESLYLNLQNMPGGIGAYTDSRGAPGIRQEIADYLTQRDGFAADPEVCRAL